jgi:hypothetical protein
VQNTELAYDSLNKCDYPVECKRKNVSLLVRSYRMRNKSKMQCDTQKHQGKSASGRFRTYRWIKGEKNAKTRENVHQGQAESNLGRLSGHPPCHPVLRYSFVVACLGQDDHRRHLLTKDQLGFVPRKWAYLGGYSTGGGDCVEGVKEVRCQGAGERNRLAASSICDADLREAVRCLLHYRKQHV